MPLAWNEIRHRAIRFANENAKAAAEAGEKQTFWNEFFEVFGLARKTVASFEAPVKKLTGHDGAIDLFWPGNLIVEHKSLGGNLSRAQSQAFEYIHALVNEGRHNEVPRYVIVSDCARIVLYDLEPEEPEDLPLFAGKRVQLAAEFNLADFYKNVRPFAFIAGYKQQKLDPEDPANIEAAQIMATLHDALKAGGYLGHELRQFLVRVLFCLFAEDTGIFPQPRQLELYLKNHTAEDGSDLGLKLARLFDVLDTPEDKRQTNLDADLKEFPYVNGDLFQERLSFADFNSDMRNALIAASGGFRWEKISPAVFGSLFQDVMLPAERRQLGAHYTAEKNIMKVVRSLFLDELWADLEAIKKDKSTRRAARLDEFHDKLAKLTFFDPACGCGNFLVITYRELRALELDVLKLKFGAQTEMKLDEVNKLSRVDVDQMFGIEIEEFPARIAEVALWLTDHQANTELSIAFTQRYIRIPLRKSPHIHVGNALRTDWKQVLAPEKCSYVLGNPPFVGKHYQTKEQRGDLLEVLSNFRNAGDVDYVAGWFKCAAEYIQGTNIKVAFVATNSITQGEQVPLIWGELLDRYRLTIHFAHRSFRWESEARGKAHVHVVIIGFAAFSEGRKVLFETTEDGSSTAVEVPFINAYLLPGTKALVRKRQTPLGPIPPMRCGNKPSDGGHLILDQESKEKFLAECPEARPLIRRFVGSDELINSIGRWCLWLRDVSPETWRKLPAIKNRVEAVRAFRAKSTAEPTKKAAERPAEFFFVSQPADSYIAIPEVSSENRRYIPIAILPATVIASNKLYVIESADPFLFGVLSSSMHMAWVKVVAGRLESRFQYSGTMVYNTFPWPEGLVDGMKQRVRRAAEKVLQQRVECGDGKLGFLPKPNARGWECSLADLYDPVAMPPTLAKAHAELDRAVDGSYRREPFASDRARVEFLFQLYEKITAPLIVATKPKRTRKLPPGKSTPQSEADAAHFYFNEEPSPYGSAQNKT